MGFFDKIQSKARLNQKAVVFLTCVLISIICWVFTSLSRPTETVISLPVSYRNLPIAGKIEGTLPGILDFHFKGSGFELTRVHLRKRPDSIIVDLSKVIKEKGLFSLNTITLSNQFPGEKHASTIIPPVISQGFVNRSSKKIPVIFNSVITYQKRFGGNGKIIIRPDSIEIAGEPEALNKINSISTERIVLHDISANKFASVYLVPLLPKGIATSVKYVFYYVQVEEYTEGTLELPVELPISQRNKITLLPPTTKVTYMASLKQFPEISISDFQALAVVPSGQTPARIPVILKRFPRGIFQVRINPEVVDYIIYE